MNKGPSLVIRTQGVLLWAAREVSSRAAWTMNTLIVAQALHAAGSIPRTVSGWNGKGASRFDSGHASKNCGGGGGVCTRARTLFRCRFSLLRRARSAAPLPRLTLSCIGGSDGI